MKAQKVDSGKGARMVRLGSVLSICALTLAGWIGAGVAIDKAFAQDIAYFRIGAGTPGSTLYDLAGRIASTISNPPGSRQCDNGGPCGVEGLIGLAQTTMDPVEGVKSVEAGLTESVIVSADIAADALNGTGSFKGAESMKDLRAIMNVGQLVLHVLVANDAPFRDLSGLKGKRIAIGVQDSDNAMTARFLLKAAGITDKKTKLLTGDLEQAAHELQNNQVDALALVALLPSEDVATMMRTGNYRLLGAQILDSDKDANVVADSIPHREYPGAETTPTLSVPAVWLVNATLSTEVANGLAKALWHSAAQVGETADARKIHVGLDHLSIPLHPGARAALAELGVPGAAEPATPEPQPSTTN